MGVSSERRIILGDIHGCINELKLLLDKLQFDPKTDELFSLGDVIRKGPESLLCLKFLREKKARIVMGNHELFFLNVLRANLPMTKDLEKLFEEMGNELDEWTQFIDSLPAFIELPDCILVHAGLEPNRPVDQTPKEVLCKIRTWDGLGLDLQNESNPAWYEFYHADKLVVFGHWAKRGLVKRPNAIGLDTGCVYGKKLSALILPDRQIVQVPALEAYCPLVE